MSSQRISDIIVGLFLTLLGGFCLLSASCLVQLGVDLTELPALLREQQQHQEREEDLERRATRLRVASSMKERVRRAVIEERITLLQAASLFRFANESGDSDLPPNLLQPEISAEVAYCRQVIRWVNSEATRQQCCVIACLAERLEAELNQRLSDPRALQLPTLSVEVISEYLRP